MFGSQPPQSSGYLGLDGLNPQQMMTMQPQAPQKGGGMFGHGGVSIDLGRALAGYLAGIGNPAGVQALQAMNEDRRQKQQHQQELDDYNRKRTDDNADLVTKLQLQQQYAQPDDFSQRVTALNQLKAGLGNTYAENYAANGGGMMPVTLPNPMTGQTMMRADKAPAQAPPAEAVARLRANPAEAQQFDQIFGPGASAQILGGPASQAPGGFPR